MLGTKSVRGVVVIHDHLEYHNTNPKPFV